jgi:predicted nuclease of predicted toxin-antitoxin system
MKFLADENFPYAGIKLLRNSGYSVFAVFEDTPGAKDCDILNRAHTENLIILTFDRDYGELIYKHNLLTPKGVVYFRFTPNSPEEPAKILIDIIKIGKPLLADKFTVVEKERIRQRPILK